MVAEALDPEALSLIEKAALINAAGHSGRAELGAVIGRVLAESPDLRSKAGLVSKEAGTVVRRVNALTPQVEVRLLSE